MSGSKKSRVPLSLRVGLIAILVVAGSVMVDAAYRKRYSLAYQWPKNILIHPEVDEKYEFVVLGNSHAQDGISFSRYRLKSLSLASVAQSYDYDLAHLKMYSRQIKKGAVIVISVSPISFSQKKSGKEDSLQTKYYDGRLSPFLIPNLKVGDYLQSQVFPFFRAGYLWREKHMSEIQERISEEERWVTPTPYVATVLDLRVPVWARDDYFYYVAAIEQELASATATPEHKYEESAWLIVDKWYHSDGFGTVYFETNRKDLERLIAYALEKQWRPVMVTLPVTGELLSRLQADYRQKYIYDNLKETDVAGVEYFDFSQDERITANDYLFANADHLNAKGASVFSYVLMHTLIEAGYVPEGADGYDYGPLPVFGEE